MKRLRRGLRPCGTSWFWVLPDHIEYQFRRFRSDLSKISSTGFLKEFVKMIRGVDLIFTEKCSDITASWCH